MSLENKGVSIIMALYNGSATIEKAVKALLEQDYESDYEVIVADDGSNDNSLALLEKFSGNSKLKIIRLKHSGVCKARNAAIKLAKYPFVINMDQDCIAGKKWLKQMMKGFDSEKIGVVSAYAYYGGTSTAFRKSLLDKVGGYDEEYGYYREDTDLSFKIMDLGYEFRLVKADYIHEHEEKKPKGIIELLKYGFKRIIYHQNDVLLYKKHHTKICEEFLHIKYGFLVDPLWDFKVATGTWEKGKEINLSSPRGIVFLENKSILHLAAICFAGICYVVAVKLSRLFASIRFRKLLI